MSILLMTRERERVCEWRKIRLGLREEQQSEARQKNEDKNNEGSERKV